MTQWRKSSRCSGNGACVEVADLMWRSTDRCAAGECVEVAEMWNRSTACGEASGCVEVADGGPLVGVRDSKLGDDSPVLRFAPARWRSFVAGLRAETS